MQFLKQANYEKVTREQIDHAAKYYQIVDKFTPNYREIPLTGKFYSKYEALCPEEADPKLFQKIHKICDMSRQEKQRFPETENQVYGWFQTKVVPFDDVNCKLCHHPIKIEQEIKQMIKIKADRSLREEDKTAMPWRN